MDNGYEKFSFPDGKRYNSFANDQDFALYFSMRLEEEA
jgi:hypothetical protein